MKKSSRFPLGPFSCHLSPGRDIVAAAAVVAARRPLLETLFRRLTFGEPKVKLYMSPLRRHRSICLRTLCTTALIPSDLLLLVLISSFRPLDQVQRASLFKPSQRRRYYPHAAAPVVKGFVHGSFSHCSPFSNLWFSH